MKVFTPSPEQSVIFNFIAKGKGNAIINAVAGSGKTTTLIEGIRLMTGSVVFAAYNKKIVEEINIRLAHIGIGPCASTFHSLGNAAWVRKLGHRPRVDTGKVVAIMGQMKVNVALNTAMSRLVSLAKQSGIGYTAPISDSGAWAAIASHHEIEADVPDEVNVSLDEIIAIAQRVLLASNEKLDTLIDFDDMIYAPLIKDAPMRQNDWVLIDEAQDTNPARRALAKKMLRADGGRLIAVGDPHQAIYGFTGADNDSLDLISQEFGTISLPLSVTYRCPKQVVEVAQRYVSHITCHETAPIGAALRIEEEEFDKSHLRPGDAVLCRNMKPLVAQAYSLIRRGIPCVVEGREIGIGLVALINRFKVKTLAELEAKLIKYRDTQMDKLLGRGQESAAQTIDDKVETLLFIINEVLESDSEIADLMLQIGRLFDDNRSNCVVLSTIHKSKGREWTRVFWFGGNRYQPSPFARQAWQKDQENNLMYVAATRAKDVLVEVDVQFNGKEKRNNGK